jgi:hypothetical protein
MIHRKSKTIYISTVLVVILLFAAISPLWAIDKQRSEYRYAGDSQSSYGLRLGLNFSNVYDITPDYDWKTGFVFGLFMDYKVNRYLSVQPEILYSMKGYEADIEYRDMEGNPFYYPIGDRDLSYLEIPILMKFNIRPGQLTRTYFSVGPYLAFLLDAEIDDRYSSIDYQFDHYIEDVDYGLSFGAGMEFPMEHGYINTDFRFSFGVVDVPEGWGNMKNQTFSMTIGFAM